ncbi:Exosome complex component RRP40 [Candida viswanathii]|uniref:Exosome complex component RRP40 n=1 Tax=Candida viswanathii TaxID=5486 RepID=A0A367XTV5_9ASCO|nr:Exosome complex component RRP40 [Candida viswanathii]
MSDTTIITPGDKLPIQDITTVKTTIGPGIYKKPQSQQLIPSSAGVFHHISTTSTKPTQLLYIESNTKRYIPHNNDFVIGLVVGTIGENYKVALQAGSIPVLLGFYAFANASKKNRPLVKNGDLVYGRITNDTVEIDNEMECVDASGKEAGFGVLDDLGFVFDVNLNFARELLFNKNSVFLELLALKCKFEIAIGINGKIWIKCGEGVGKKDGGTAAQEDEDQEMKDAGEDDGVKDLKNTLAAVKFLTRCQYVTQDKLKDELNKAFRGV